uniref:plasmid replication protein, CyRepA1 family n=1 Tax=Myxosarcina sp. GI1 TaxID=1541065 RepID=UPI00055AD5FE
GGHFRGSPEQLAEIVKGHDKFAIVPDAGDVINTQVMLRWRRLVEHLEPFELPIYFLWWGQVSKREHQDIDEIDSQTFSQAEYLNPEQFFALAKKKQWVKKQWDGWKTYKKFTPQIKIEKQFVEFGLPQKNTITFIKSGLGTGKTTLLIKLLKQLEEKGIISLGYRNTLLLQFNEKAKKLGFYHLQNDKDLESFNLADPTINVSNCVDSLPYYKPEQFDGKIIVIDEIVSVLKHLLFSKTIRDFERVKDLFTEMVRRCDRLICLDGFVQDWAVKFFKELCPPKQIVTIENIYQGDKAQIYLLQGTIDLDEKLRANDNTPWLEKLLNNSVCPAICSDSQAFCEAIENLLVKQGRRGIRVDSKTVSDKQVKDFFKNPDRWIKENKPEYVIYSPSAESGLDIPTKSYFTEHFAFFFGRLDIDSCIQMLGRIRDINVPKYVWCKRFILSEEVKRRPSNLESIQADRARSLMAELHLVIEDGVNLSKEQIISQIQEIHSSNLDPYTTAADTCTAIRNHEFSNYRECLERQLTDNGYPVEAVTLKSLDNRKAIALQEKEAKTEVKQQNANDIYTASDRYIGQEQVKLNFDSSWETRCAVTKAILVSQLPDINRDPVWSPEFIKLVKYDKPNLIKQTELYYLLDNPDLAKQLSLLKYNSIFNRGKIAAPWKLRQNYLKVKALRDVGIHNFYQKAIADPDFTFQANSPEVIAIINKCRRRKNKDVLGMPGKDPIKFVNRLLRSVGISVRSRKVKQEGKVGSIYFIDREHLFTQERLAIFKAIKLKYAQKIQSKKEPLEWVVGEQNFSQNTQFKNRGQEIAQTTAIHSLDVVADYHQNYINNSAICNLSTSDRTLANLPINMHITNQLQTTLDSPESIADLTWMLSMLEDAKALAELQTIPEFTSKRLNRAAKQLSLSKRRQIQRWAIENQQRKASA